MPRTTLFCFTRIYLPQTSTLLLLPPFSAVEKSKWRLHRGSITSSRSLLCAIFSLLATTGGYSYSTFLHYVDHLANLMREDRARNVKKLDAIRKGHFGRKEMLEERLSFIFPCYQECYSTA